MTVKELIEKLKEFPEDMKVEYFDHEYNDYLMIEHVKIVDSPLITGVERKVVGLS